MLLLLLLLAGEFAGRAAGPATTTTCCRLSSLVVVSPESFLEQQVATNGPLMGRSSGAAVAEQLTPGGNSLELIDLPPESGRVEPLGRSPGPPPPGPLLGDKVRETRSYLSDLFDLFQPAAQNSRAFCLPERRTEVAGGGSQMAGGLRGDNNK